MSLTLLLNSGETRLPQARASTGEEEKHEQETSFLLGNKDKGERVFTTFWFLRIRLLGKEKTLSFLCLSFVIFSSLYNRLETVFTIKPQWENICKTVVHFLLF